ncbi:UDP-N-acetylmuramate--L-alanine ligase [Candidatus Arthromitus sp. SFB-rat-Yit]|uniref:UDP-N-acetylmuramate--L-alanine ligase n=1 Tax=Candidatus Arthromitus sp. SFB-rat-Yit TaxID=1041504 RepID=UPI0005C4F2F1|nr:UDP-N-acetylmuramate--L-alanine ligase [Candidatus Arthromitus sp. SFB-rat-Yit]
MFLDRIIKNNQYIHLIGIGGVSMSGIASILLDRGFKVSGSDICKNPLIINLENKGCKIKIEHNSKNIDNNIGIVVHTAAVGYENNEIKEAIKRKIPVINRSEFLGELTKKYNKCITISGTHGKTTTTSIFSYVMMYNNLDPTILIGGELDLIGGNFKIGKSDYLLMEACEYKKSFLNFSTDIGVILNIDKDHLDCYEDLDDIKDAFCEYAKNIPYDGWLIYCASDKLIGDILDEAKCKKVSYGIGCGDVNAINISKTRDSICFDVLYKEKIYDGFRINVIGNHNLLNALSAITFSLILDFDLINVKKALLDFSLPKRRFEMKGERDGIKIIEDYAHHPTEIKALIDMTKSLTNGKIYCFFQPHTYSRTLTLLDEFSKSFDGVEEVILFDIYAAREKNIWNITFKDLKDKIISTGQKCHYAKSFDDAVDYMKCKGERGDIFLVVGAGNICELSDKFVNV